MEQENPDNGQERSTTDDDVQNTSWPLPLPESVVVRALLPATDAETGAALRLTCSALRDVIDASILSITLSGSPREVGSPHENLVSFAAALPRLSTLRCLELSEATDPSIAAFAALALPQLTQLTSLKISMEEEDEYPSEDDGNLAPATAPVAPYGGLVLGLHLTSLQRLEEFIGPDRRHAWGVLAGERIASALARLPALRQLELHCDITAEMLFGEPCEMLGADAWRSLEVLKGKGWSVDGIKVLARTPLRHLADLFIHAPVCKPGDDSLCAILSAAPWAKQLERLFLDDLSQGTPVEMLSGLRLPNLRVVCLFGDDYLQEPFSAPLPTEAWHLPKLQLLWLDCRLINDPAASFAGLQLPLLDALTLVGRKLAGVELSALLSRSPWVPQIEEITIWGPDEDTVDAVAWAAAMARAPLSKLRELQIYGGDVGIDPTAAALLGGAPWMRGLKKLQVPESMNEAAVAALRAGNGGYAELEAAGKVSFY